ncbi:MAG TPA: hypothetical protein V6C88_09795 [Chroococcidiopsis sp.]
MSIALRMRHIFTVFVLVCVLSLTTACGSVSTRSPQASYPGSLDRSAEYSQLERGDSATGQAFGDWVVQTSRGLIKDAFVRGNDKLGAVISSKVRPEEIKPLAQSLAQGFRKNFPKKDLTVLIYAPDKELLLTARYNARSNQIEYEAAS